ncbi:MAG TPA: AlkA N-terminal domain-containing protein [Myxococcota bacterium]|nr:AlkA N-terminal domain-containing protein [Myxococcota bacterium]
MELDGDNCFRAMRARDRRFDGVFFVGVKTTGVYCRPICPARTPRRDRCAFFRRAVDAEQAGFRACFRCRPELAPGLAAVDSIPRLVRAAVARIEAGRLNDGSLEQLAAELGVTARHLRRAMTAELGTTPVALAQTRRLALAKQLLHDTPLALVDVAFAAGFASVRRFNALFQARFGRPPSALRRAHGAPSGGAGRSASRRVHGGRSGGAARSARGVGKSAGDGGRSGRAADGAVALRLDYRPPLDWDALLAFLAARALPELERVGDGEYARWVTLGGRVGFVAVRADTGRPALRARVSVSLAPKLMEVSAQLRALFDLDARPDVIADHLSGDRALRGLLRARPGLRVPGAFDGFELAVRAVLGQQVSVRAATTLAGRLVAAFGRGAAGAAEAPAEALADGQAPRLFPAARVLAAASATRVQALGMPRRRAEAVVALARAVADGRVDLAPGADPARTVAALTELPGVGAWTAQYVAMRALKWPDAFPAGDLALQKALGVGGARAAEARASAWAPWRAYAVMHLWSSLTETGG